MGANGICDDKSGFRSLAKGKGFSSKRFGSITESEPEKLKKHIHEVLPDLSFHEIKDVLSVIYRIKQIGHVIGRFTDTMTCDEVSSIATMAPIGV